MHHALDQYWYVIGIYLHLPRHVCLNLLLRSEALPNAAFLSHCSVRAQGPRDDSLPCFLENGLHQLLRLSAHFANVQSKVSQITTTIDYLRLGCSISMQSTVGKLYVSDERTWKVELMHGEHGHAWCSMRPCSSACCEFVTPCTADGAMLRNNLNCGFAYSLMFRTRVRMT